MSKSSWHDHDSIKTAFHKGTKVSIEDALELNAEFEKSNEKSKTQEKPTFTCETCGEKLRADKDRFGRPGQFCEKHFEHTKYKEGMNTCSRRDPESDGYEDSSKG